MSEASNERFIRQLGIYNPAERPNDKATFIGVGGIGSFAAFGAAKLGIPNLVFIDPDDVEDHNIPNQMYTEDHLELYDTGTEYGDTTPKVVAMEDQVLQLTRPHEPNIVTHRTGLPDDDVSLDGLVISGLDTMKARQEIWHECIKLKPRITRYLDARLSGEFIIVYSVNPTDMHDCDRYEDQALFDDDEAEDLLCTERGIIDVGMQVGSLLTNRIRRHFRGDDIPNITMMNMASYVTTQGAWLGDDTNS